MKDGFIRVAAASPALRVADCSYNLEQSLLAAQRAAAEGAQLLVLPELGLTGYSCGDLFFQRPLQLAAQKALVSLARQTAALPLALAVGLPLADRGKLYNCAAVLCRGRILGIVPKTHLPNYAEFYERRQFTPAFAGLRSLTLAGAEEMGPIPFGSPLLFCCQELPALCFGVEICEDLWVPCPPSAALAANGATVILNLSASNETAGKAAYRRSLVCGQSARLACAYLYAGAGCGESTTDLVFSGHKLIAENGALVAEAPPFGDPYLSCEIDLGRLLAERGRATTYPAPADLPQGCQVSFSLPLQKTRLTRDLSPTPFVPRDPARRAQRCEEILTIQAVGLCRRMEHTRCAGLVLGVSGGLDSTLALLVAVRALDRLGRPHRELAAVTMPCFGTTRRTRNNAQLLCETLNVPLRTIDITQAVRLHFQQLGHDEANHNVVYENAQARERTQLLMDLANAQNSLVVGTGDLSELALGWATYNGDQMSMYGVNASIPKTLVRHLVQYAADAAEDPQLRRVLADILDTPVSPELLPADSGQIAQRTEDLVGPYLLHDFFLYYMLRFGFAPGKIYRLALHAFAGQFDPEEILKWLRTFYRRFFAQQFKRSCMPDGPKVGSVALSPRGDWRMPSDACAALWLEEIDRLQPAGG